MRHSPLDRRTPFQRCVDFMSDRAPSPTALLEFAVGAAAMLMVADLWFRAFAA